MKVLQLILWIVLLLQQEWPVFANKAPYSAGQVNENQGRSVSDVSASSVLGSMYRKSRQSRCVRCYEDRYGDDRSRSYGSGYASRSSDDDRNWYRYDDRYRGSSDRDYDRSYSSYYRDRDDRYSPRTYDRYDGRGSESRGYEGRGYDSRGYDPYSDRKSSYNDYYRDRSYDRSRQGYGTDRDYYDRDRYYTRYDFRNYRPWDETYRGQSGFDKSGRGYYFAGAYNGQSYLPDDRSQPCSTQVTNCPNRDSGSTTVTSRPIDSSGQNGQSGSGSQVINSSANSNANGANRNGWTYVNEQDKSTRGNGESERESDRDRNRDRDHDRSRDRDGERERERDRDRDRNRERDQQSSSYGGRAPRPLGGSYLLDRDSNLVSDDQTNANTAAMSDKTANKDMPNAETPPERTEGAAGGKQ